MYVLFGAFWIIFTIFCIIGFVSEEPIYQVRHPWTRRIITTIGLWLMLLVPVLGLYFFCTTPACRNADTAIEQMAMGMSIVLFGILLLICGGFYGIGLMKFFGSLESDDELDEYEEPPLEE